MRFKQGLLWAAVVCVVVISLASAEGEEGKNGPVKAKRRKIRRKLKKGGQQQQEEAEVKLPEVLAEVEPEQETQVKAEEPRDGRGFLDQYYQQFDKRISTTIDETDSVSTLPNDNFGIPTRTYETVATDSGIGNLASPYLSNPGGSRLPKQYQDEPQHHLTKEEILERVLPVVTEASGKNPYQHKRTLFPGLASSSAYSTNYGSPTTSYGSTTGYGSTTNFIDDSSYKDTSFSTKELASKYFGVATTTSRDIQLGLTFTVPFLSIPLGGLTDIFSGGSSATSGLNDFFNFDSTTLVTIAILAIGAIFILPQVIYWLTGVNLSAFSWGRSDDPNYITNLADNVDKALRRYDVDSKECLATTLCQQIKKGKKKDKDSSITSMLGYGLVKTVSKTDALKTFMGTNKMEEITKVAESEYNCEDVYQVSSCPWDEKKSKRIIAKLLVDSDMDLSTLASLAIQGAKAFS